jgi:hypothetical protein
VNRLKWWIRIAVSTVVGSLVGAMGWKVLGFSGLILGFVGGEVAGWWVVQRYFDF